MSIDSPFFILSLNSSVLTGKSLFSKFAKLGSKITGGNGGGGRKDFAQAGGQDISKIKEATQKLKELI